MGINDLMKAAKREIGDSKKRKDEEAKSILKTSDVFEYNLRKIIPSLFEGEYPIKRFYVFEPVDDCVTGNESWCLAALLDKNILIYTYRNSFQMVICCKYHEQGSSEYFTKMTSSGFCYELSSNPETNTINVADMISNLLVIEENHD
jgi:hypothetical protein